MADSNLPKPFRSHDYIIDATGHLLERPPAPRYPPDPGLRYQIIRAEQLAEKRDGDKELEGEEAAFYEPVPPEELEPEPPLPPILTEPARYTVHGVRIGRPRAYPAETPKPDKNRHDEVVAAVAGLVRQGVGYTEAMDRVLEDAPVVSAEPPRKPVAPAETSKALNLQVEREALLQIIQELRELQEKVKAKRSDWGKPITRKGEAEYLARQSDVPVDLHKPGTFFSKANQLIRQAYDLTDVLNAREKFILSGGLADYEHIGALLRIGWSTLDAMNEAFSCATKKRAARAASLPDSDAKEA